jgi:signal transduction histidine kinase
MTPVFRRLPFPYKLMLIGLIPVLFLIYLSYKLYNERTEKVKLIGDYIERIEQFKSVSTLMSELQTERRYSFQYALTKQGNNKILAQRVITDSLIRSLENSEDLAIKGFTKYTFLADLPAIRKALDTSANYSSNAIMQYYTNAIVRLNSLNLITPPSDTYLQPVYQDMISQKTLSEMIVYLGIIRTNIYNVLHTRQYMAEMLMGTTGVYSIYKTYEIELLLKASDSTRKLYQTDLNTSALGPTINYIDKLFKTFAFDSTSDADGWWNVSTNGINVLRKLQTDLWHDIRIRINTIYKNEKTAKDQMLIFLILTLLLVGGFVAYSIHIISLMLTELRVAAQKISKGGTGFKIANVPDDVMGSLALSILEIDENNKLLANAADAIGKGNFDVTIRPRSSDDLLGNSLKRMKKDLHHFTLQREKAQKETLRLLNKKDEFISIVSHELKTPVTSLKAYTQILQSESLAAGNSKKEGMFSRMDAQVNKLTNLINDLVDISKVQDGQLIYSMRNFKLNDLVSEIVDEIQRTTKTHQITIQQNPLLKVYADRERIGQVLSNLLNNSIKYSANSNKVVVNLVVHETKAICSVQDFGIGIVKDQQDKIFDRFYRVTGENLYTYPGWGLGLYISKEIIKRHNEKIWVQSEVGKGSAFYFSLPLTANGDS